MVPLWLLLCITPSRPGNQLPRLIPPIFEKDGFHWQRSNMEALRLLLPRSTNHSSLEGTCSVSSFLGLPFDIEDNHGLYSWGHALQNLCPARE